MAYTPLKTGTPTASAESVRTTIKKIDSMIEELYAFTSEGDLSSISQNIVPDGSNTRDLGSPSNPWRNIYVVELDGGSADTTYE
jgi:hypothetical protein